MLLVSSIARFSTQYTSPVRSKSENHVAKFHNFFLVLSLHMFIKFLLVLIVAMLDIAWCLSQNRWAGIFITLAQFQYICRTFMTRERTSSFSLSGSTNTGLSLHNRTSQKSFHLFLDLKGYFRQKVFFCHIVVLKVWVIFFIWRKNCFILTRFRFLCFWRIQNRQNLWRHNRQLNIRSHVFLLLCFLSIKMKFPTLF